MTNTSQLPCLCGHPRHKGIAPEPITAAAAKQLWNERDKGGNMMLALMAGPKLSAAQCETVMLCWEKLPGNYSYAATFSRIMRSGSDRIMKKPGRGK
jgi:hypothetical protein